MASSRGPKPPRRRQVHRFGTDPVARHDLELRAGGEVRVGDGSGPGDPGVGTVQQHAQLIEVVVGGAAEDPVPGLGGSRDQVEVAVREGAARDEDDAHQCRLPANHGARAV